MQTDAAAVGSPRRSRARASKVAGISPPTRQIPDRFARVVARGLEAWADHISHTESRATYRSLVYTQRYAFFNNRKARRELALPHTPFEDTVARAIGWWRAQGML